MHSTIRGQSLRLTVVMMACLGLSALFLAAAQLRSQPGEKQFGLRWQQAAASEAESKNSIQSELPRLGGAQAKSLLGKKLARALHPETIKLDPAQVRDFLLSSIQSRLSRLPTPPSAAPKSSATATTITNALIREANRHGMDPLMLLAVMIQESGVNPHAVGRHGEIGLMQIKPSTARALARELGEKEPTRNELFDTRVNIRFGTAYLAHLKQRFNLSTTTLLKTYNLGPASRSQGGTSRYVRKIAGHYGILLANLARPAVSSDGLENSNSAMNPRSATSSRP